MDMGGRVTRIENSSFFEIPVYKAAMKVLQREGYVTLDEESCMLTEKGKQEIKKAY
jgi:predicted methyltransferase